MSYDITLSMTSLTCCHMGCGITFAVPDWWEQKRREDHASFTCPHGHSQSFRGESDTEKLLKQVASKQAELDRMNAALRDTREQRDKAEKKHLNLKRRVSAGCCPFCKRNVRQLRVHVEKCHPKEISK